jgi:hypothetical protein
MVATTGQLLGVEMGKKEGTSYIQKPKHIGVEFLNGFLQTMRIE